MKSFCSLFHDIVVVWIVNYCHSSFNLSSILWYDEDLKWFCYMVFKLNPTAPRYILSVNIDVNLGIKITKICNG